MLLIIFIGNEIKICSQNKCHHHLSNVCENSFRMFHSNWVTSDYHSFVWQFEFPWLNLTNCPNKWMVIRNDPVTVKHTKWIFTDVEKVMMAFILATDFDFIAYMSKMAFFFFFFFFGSFFHANGVFGIWLQWKVCHAKKKKKGKADLTAVLHIRELPHLHMKLAVWFSFPTTNNKNLMIPSWSLVPIYNYSFNPDQIFTKNFEILELEICSKIFTRGIFLQANSSLPTNLKKYVLSH